MSNVTRFNIPRDPKNDEPHVDSGCKTCPKCKISKTYDNFHACAGRHNGLSVYCKKCKKNYAINNILNRKKYLRKYYEQNRLEYLISKAKYRAKIKNLDFNLNSQKLILPQECPVFGTKFIVGTNGPNKYSCTIDRIDNNLGYINDNIVFVSHKANSIKNNSTMLELENLIKNLKFIVSLKECSWEEKIGFLGLETQAINRKKLYDLLGDARRRSKKQGKGAQINLKHLENCIPKKCCLLEMSIITNKKKQQDNSITLDKIDHNEGYEINNLLIISLKANRMKQDASLDDLVKVHKFYKNLYLFTNKRE